MDSVPESAAVNESVKLCKKLKCFSAQGFVNGMLRRFIRSGKKISYLGLEPEKRLSVEYSCPEWLTEKLIREYLGAYKGNVAHAVDEVRAAQHTAQGAQK